MNTAKIIWRNKDIEATIDINGKPFMAQLMPTGRYLKDCSEQRWIAVRASNDYNMSAPFLIQAKTVEKLIEIIERHEYKLVHPYR